MSGRKVPTGPEEREVARVQGAHQPRPLPQAGRKGDAGGHRPVECAEVLHPARIKHFFAHQKNRFGLFIPTIGLARAEARLTFANLAYNFDRLIFNEPRRQGMGPPEMVEDQRRIPGIRTPGSWQR